MKSIKRKDKGIGLVIIKLVIVVISVIIGTNILLMHEEWNIATDIIFYVALGSFVFIILLIVGKLFNKLKRK